MLFRSIYVPNVTSGGQYYTPDAKLVEAIQGLDRGESGTGVRAAQFAKLTTGESFNISDSRGDGYSTKATAGSNRAMAMAHEALQRKGLLIPFPSMEMQGAVWPHRRQPTAESGPGRPGGPVAGNRKMQPV